MGSEIVVQWTCETGGDRCGNVRWQCSSGMLSVDTVHIRTYYTVSCGASYTVHVVGGNMQDTWPKHIVQGEERCMHLPGVANTVPHPVISTTEKRYLVTSRKPTHAH